MSKRDHATTPRPVEVGGGGRTKPVDPEAISKRAYELFLQRGSQAGHEMEDWLLAEAELTATPAGPRAGIAATLAATRSDAPGDATPANDAASSGTDPRRADRDRGAGRRSARQQPSH